MPHYPVCIALAATLTTTTASAADILASYYTALGPQDYFNSSGAPLGSFAGVLQQDRANYHRFGRADPSDESDPYFSNREMRAAIPALFAAGPNDWWEGRVTPPAATRGEADIVVFICGTGGRVTHVVVDHANGDGYRGC